MGRKAREKASRMTEHIGFPSELLNMGLLTHHYSKQRPQTMRLRVMTTLSNMEEFAKDFQCPVGSKMNPPKSKKCKVWWVTLRPTQHLLPYPTIYLCYLPLFINV